MKAVFVESYNGAMALHADDIMGWTPPLDKKLFRLLTYAFGGVCVCSKHTYLLLPKKMLADEDRQFIIAEHTGLNSLYALNERFPNAVLLGGPEFLKAADEAGVIDTFIVTTLNREVKLNPRYANPFLEKLLLLPCRGEVRFEDMAVRIYRNERKFK